jgi:hypothetical protein
MIRTSDAESEEDAMVGSVLTDSRPDATVPASSAASHSALLAAAAFGGSGVAVLAAAGLVAAIALGGLVWWGSSAPGAPPVALAPIVLPAGGPAPTDRPAAPPTPTPAPLPVPAPAAVVAADSPPASSSAASRPRAVEPAPVTTPAPAPPPRAAGAVHAVVFRSIPLGARVFVDGVYVGDAPLTVELTAGKRKVQMVSGADRVERTLDVDGRSPPRYMWRVADASWEASW